MWSQRTAQIQKQFSPGPGKPPASTVPANVKAEDHGQAAVDDDEQEADDVGVVTDGLRSPSLDDAGTEKTQLRTESKFSAVEAREAELKQELEGVRKVSKTVEELIDSLEKTEGNMQVGCDSRAR